ncbi:MAG TPA: DUF309 domain-containing protein, partial [Streptosporangiaceae bacterium]
MPGDAVPRDREPSRPRDRDPSRPRDRDPSGRPRNARPRDGLGRPLDHADADAGLDRIPDDLVITGHDAAVLADQLLRDGRPFHAHEVLEAAWKTGPPDERDLWQGLAQIAVGLTHARRGNARGAVTLLRRGTQRIRTHQTHPGAAGRPDPAAGPGSRPPGEDHRYGLDIPAVLAAADDLASRIEQHGLDHIPRADFAP